MLAKDELGATKLCRWSRQRGRSGSVDLLLMLHVRQLSSPRDTLRLPANASCPASPCLPSLSWPSRPSISRPSLVTAFLLFCGG